MELRVLIAGLLIALPVVSLAAEDGTPHPSTDVFVTKCSSCHSVGEGDRVGPDLKGVTERRKPDWLATMIKAPSRLLDSDPEVRALLAKYNNVRMPDLGLDDEQVAGLIDLVAHCSEHACQLTPELRPVTEAVELDAAHGRALFLGTAMFTNGGPSCISCHTVSGTGAMIGGGTLAKDITNVFARLGDDGLDAALRNPSFPLMNKVFGDHPLSAEEAFALRAYLYDANRGKHQGAGVYQLSVPMASLIGAIAVLILLNTAWSRRLRGVRRELVRHGGRPS